LFLPLLLKFSGIIFLGIGDSLAAIVGKRFGRLTLPVSGKSIEGFLAGFIGMVISVIMIVFYKGFGDHGKLAILLKLNVYKNLFMILAAVSFAETFTKQMDNLIIPYIMYIMLGHMDLAAYNRS